MIQQRTGVRKQQSKLIRTRSKKRVRANTQKRTIFLTGRSDIATVNFSAVRAYIGSPPRRNFPKSSRVSTQLGLNKSDDYSLKLDSVKKSLIDKIANRDLMMMQNQTKVPRPSSQIKKSLEGYKTLTSSFISN